ncbi:hypothetical protein [Lentilactobacillus diolivorans]|uniref:Surface layer protein A domain-containing protein n=2 Tax=Lentilactobacillus diolivorans TaxID=179838 RepID=A0A0R1SEW5_9LACO|nr:hypothetical protein [Lentilactobacillus diolivorans]KRL65082.1 hypothetical protein FC85_GL000578 [Lentilactobacillus diolivorans DSM 14421]GEP23505.1 hypothetical protein LDI01_10980 [Lentilactobacillus diolivorans]
MKKSLVAIFITATLVSSIAAGEVRHDTTVNASSKTYHLTNHSQTFKNEKTYHPNQANPKVYRATLHDDGEMVSYTPKTTLNVGETYHVLRKTAVKDHSKKIATFLYIAEKAGWVKSNQLDEGIG